MSKQDTHFINIFSLVIGLLVVVAICIFFFARIIASQTQDKQVLSEREYNRSVAARIAPPSEEAIAGKDNSALAIKSEAGAAAAPVSPAGLPKSGSEVFQQVCSTCHGAGIAAIGSPSTRRERP